MCPITQVVPGQQAANFTMLEHGAPCRSHTKKGLLCRNLHYNLEALTRLPGYFVLARIFRIRQHDFIKHVQPPQQLKRLQGCTMREDADRLSIQTTLHQKYQVESMEGYRLSLQHAASCTQVQHSAVQRRSVIKKGWGHTPETLLSWEAPFLMAASTSEVTLRSAEHILD